MSTISPTIDPSSFRTAVGYFASGITIITSCFEGEPLGFTCQSFYSVSMSPPLVSFSVMKSSASYPKIRQAGRFAVNILSEDQESLSNQFALRGTEKWQGVDWQASPLGNPLISGNLHWIDCEIQSEYEAGDHIIVLGKVNSLNLNAPDSQPLLYFKGQYRSIA